MTRRISEIMGKVMQWRGEGRGRVKSFDEFVEGVKRRSPVLMG